MREGVDLLLCKRVPVVGGMAGGSADAAATLVACNQLWGTGLNPAELTGLAVRLGADVPFPLLGATAVGHGRGDDLSPLMTRGTYQWVFALAHEGLSTPVVFARFDELAAAAGRAPVTREVPDALTTTPRTGDPGALAPALHNMFPIPMTETSFGISGTDKTGTMGISYSRSRFIKSLPSSGTRITAMPTNCALKLLYAF